MFKSVPQVYRDCLRLIDHIGGQSRKAEQMRKLVANEFRAHAEEKDETKIESLKKNAMAGLANYLTIESLGKLESQPNANANRGIRPGQSPNAHLNSVPQMNQPVSERVLALQRRIRAEKAARDAAKNNK